MVDNKLNTGSKKKKHLAETKKEKTEKIVTKVKLDKEAQEQGPPAKKQKKIPEPKDGAEKEIKGENGENAGKKARRKSPKKKKIGKEKVKNATKSEEVQNELVKKASDYLDLWKNDKTNWRFSKNLQTWLIVNMFNVDRVQNEKFETLAEYLKGALGDVRTHISKVSIQKAREIRLKDATDDEEEAEENQEILSRTQRLIKLMASEAKTATKSNEKKAPATKADSLSKKKRKNKGKNNRLGIGKDGKAKVASVKEESKENIKEEAPAKKKKAAEKVVSFDEEVPAPIKKNKKTEKAPAVNGKGKKAAATLGQVKKGKKKN